MIVLGISCFYHDSAAVITVDGDVIAAAEEERFTRKKHDNSFPEKAISYCLKESKVEISEVDKVVFYEKPIQKFDRILETAAISFPRGYRSFSQTLPEWLGTKLRIKKHLKKKLGYNGKVEYLEHHHSHAASAFLPSPFDEAAVLTVDGVGEWTTNQMFKAENEEIQPLKHIEFPDSLGLLYSTITAYLGFMVNNDEYKVMGLASYGKPEYLEEFEELIEINRDGSYSLNQEFFAFTRSKKMWSSKLEKLLGDPRIEGEIKERHQNIAATLQKVLEEVLMKQINYLYKITETENLCMSGGVALNSASNGKIREEMPFENIWIQPAAGDAGGAMGAALSRSEGSKYTMKNSYLGPEYGEKEVEKTLKERNADYQKKTREELIENIVERVRNGEIIGLHQGRMEWGPRALGNRSILADPRKEEIIDIINKKVKYREEFRPFAPTVLEEEASEYFDITGNSPYMLFVFNADEERKEEIPAVTHVDDTSRIQTLNRETNPFYYDIIKKFQAKTGIPVLLNTSFNLKGMPIVNTPEEAYQVLKKSGMNAFATRNFIVEN